jgi:ABC-type Na+ efflux pump permease subunit
MRVGLFLRRELLASSRRGSTFGGRAFVTGLVLAVIAAVFAIWDANSWERASVSGMTGFTLRIFGFIVGLLAVLLMVGVPNEVAAGLAGERDRKTLDVLLTTRLTDAEIVLGTTAAALLRSAWGPLVIFPILMWMVPFGGIDPRLILLAYGGLASYAFALAGLSAVVSLGARDFRSAANRACVLAVMWLVLPFPFVVLLPRLWTTGAQWSAPVALLALDSSPVGVLASLVGLGRVGPMGAFARMVGLQLAGGALLLFWAVVRVRPACRAADDEEGRSTWLLQNRRAHRERWPACGDDPVLWREIHAKHGPRVGVVTRLLDRLVSLALLAAIIFGTYWFAEPAFRELLARGYGPGPADAHMEITPFAMALVRAPSQGPPPGMARVEFNEVLREFTPALVMYSLLVLALCAGEGIAAERARDTLSGLIATPLTGREILRAKMLGAAWRARRKLALPVVLWALGLLAGALHPLGVLAALGSLGVAGWFLVSLATYHSLRARDPGQAAGWPTFLVLVLTIGPLAGLMVPGSALLHAGSPAFHAWASLASYEDVRDLLRSGVYPPLAKVGVGTADGLLAVLAACLAVLIAEGVAAALLTRAAYRGFDAAVGRPTRAGRTGPASNKEFIK